MKATTELMRQDLRTMRAMPLVHRIMQIVSDHISDEDHRRDAQRRIHDELFDALRKEGVEILTDHMRQDMGLPARGPDGWTIEEIIALEQRRLEMLTRPMLAGAPFADKRSQPQK